MLAVRFRFFGIFTFALAWLAYDHYRPWVNFHSEALALVGVGLMVLGRCLDRTAAVVVLPRIAWWIMVLALLPWLQYLLGISLFAGDALLVSLYICGFGAAMGLGFGYASEAPEPDAALVPIFYVLWFVALMSAAIGLLQWLNLQQPLQMYVVQTDAGDRPMGNLGQPNQLATLLLMGIASLAWTFERRRVGVWGLSIGVIFLSMVLVLTLSRAAMLSALVTGIFLIWKRRMVPGRLAPWHVFAWLLLFGAANLLLPSLHEALLMGNIRSVSFGGDSRFTMWKQVLSGVAESPWVGYGWNQTSTAHMIGSLTVAGTMTYTNAHNVVVDILAWNGVPLGLLLTVLCAYWFMSRIHGATRDSAIYAMACLLPIAIHSMVEYPFAYSYFLLAGGLMAGVVEASHNGIKTIKLKLRWVGGALAIWFVIGSYMVYEYLLIEEDFRIVRFENLRIGQTSTEYEVPHVWMLSHMASMLQAARQQAAPGMSAAEVENLRKASLRFPYGSLGLRYALALGLNGDPAGASRQMAIIRGMYGDHYYQAAVSVMRELQREKYPELAQVIAP